MADFFVRHSLLPVPVHELFHAVQGFFDLAVFGCIAHARKPIAAGTEGIARHNGHMLFAQQFFGEGLIVHAGGADVGEGIERAARLEGRADRGG